MNPVPYLLGCLGTLHALNNLHRNVATHNINIMNQLEELQDYSSFDWKRLFNYTNCIEIPFMISCMS